MLIKIFTIHESVIHMIRHLVLILLVLLVGVNAGAETTDEIRANKAYLTGTGYGETLDLARSAALAEILSKISITVKGDFMSKEVVTQQNGELDSEAQYEMTIHSYSTATLNNVKSMVVKNEPDAEVLMWIPKTEIDRIFEGRLSKAKEYTRIANEALEQGQIDDALRYYYWAYKLTQSLRRPNEATILADGEERKMIPWLYAQIDRVMSQVEMSVGKKIDDTTWELNATWQGKPARSLGYTYFDGIDNTLASMRDGRGLIELRPGANPTTVQVKLEFEFRDIARTVDPEIDETMKANGVSRFAHAYVNVDLASNSPESAPATPASQHVSSASNVAATDAGKLAPDMLEGLDQRVIHPIMRAIDSGNFSGIDNLFTPDGLSDFKKIMGYGKVRLLPESELQYFAAEDGGIVCRGVAVSCRFQGRRTFTEQLSFAVNPAGRVHHVSMGVGSQLAQDIALGHSEWSEESRKRLVDFLEDYRTAYALKDVDYMERVFDDNAVIVVGVRNVQVASQLNESYWQMNDRVKLTKYSKKEFIKRLRRTFASKEYINLIFSNSRIIKPRADKEIYSIEVKQDYFSSNYGDSGYLTLVMDLTDPANPVIHVRTWQEEPDPQFGVISINDF